MSIGVETSTVVESRAVVVVVTFGEGCILSFERSVTGADAVIITIAI